MFGSGFNLNSGLTIDGMLRVPGMPEIRVNGGGMMPPLELAGGSADPSNYRITLNHGVSIGGIVRAQDPADLPAAPAPAAGAGTRHVQLNQPGDSPGDFATLRSLTINAQGATVTLPPGKYDRITLNGASTVILDAGTVAAPALYEIQQIDLNGGSRIDATGPVELRLKNSLNANGYIGRAARPEWLEMSISAGSFTLNSQSAFHGTAIVPGGSLTVNGGSLLHGLAFTHRLTLNGGGVIECEASGGTPNRPPVATGSEITTPVGAPVEVVLQAADPENQPLAFSIATPPLHGTVEVDGIAATYTPDLGFIGTDIFHFTASDGSLDSEAAPVVIHVFQPNRPPVTESVIFVINQGESEAPLTLVGSDPDGDPLTYEILTSPRHGTLGGVAPSLTYSHSGARSTQEIVDDFTYRAVDSDGVVSEVATVTLQLQPVNRLPVAAGVAATGMEDGTIAFVFDASDPDGDGLIFDFTLPEGFPGTITRTGAGGIFTPAADYSGMAAFSYTATDPSGASATAAVVLMVTAVNDAPVLAPNPLPLEVAEDDTIRFIPAGTDPDGEALTYEITGQPAHGSLFGNPDGSFIYSPAANFHGADSFTYVAKDAETTSAPGVVGIVVTPVNDGPVAAGSRHQTREGTRIEIPLVAADADGDELFHQITTAPVHGTSVVAANRAVYVPAPGFSGVDRFRFTATDGTLLSAEAEVVVRVSANPRVTLVTPMAGARFPAGEPLVVKAEASDADGDLSSVEIRMDGARIGSGTSAALEVALGELPAGDHVLVASAMDAAGGTMESAAVTFTVEATNLPPLVAAGADRVVLAGQAGENLLQNPGSEQPPVDGKVPAWSEEGATSWGQGTAASRKRGTVPVYPAAIEGGAYFHVTGAESAGLYQDVELNDGQVAAVSGGAARIAFEAQAFSYQPKDSVPSDYGGGPDGTVPVGDLDRASAVVEFRDEHGHVLQTLPAVGGHVGDRWVTHGAGGPVPAATRRIRVRLIAENASSPDVHPTAFVTLQPAEKNDVLFDAVSLRLIPPAEDFLTAAIADDGLPEEGNLTTTWSQITGPAAFIREPDQAVTAVAFPAAGDYEFRVEADDGRLAAVDSVTIRVEDPAGNVPPVVAAGDDLTVALSTTSFPLNGTVTDEAPGIAVSWAQVSGPSAAVFADPLAAATSVNVALPGRFVFRLTAFDGEWSAEDEVTVDVTAPTVRRPLDLAIVTDHSGSMWANKPDGDPATPIYKARLTADRIISQLDAAQDRVAVHKFRSQVIPLTQDLALARASLIQLRGESGTTTGYQASNISKGIELASNHLLASPRTGPVDRVIVVFGDGAGPYDDDTARAARNAGIRVIIVAFSNGIDPISTANMKALASSPADFIDAATPEEALRVIELLHGTLNLPLNSPPQVDAGPGIELSGTAEIAFLRGSFRDDGLPASSTPTIFWEQLSGPAPAAFGSADRLDSKVSFSAAGEYWLRLTVDDGALSSSDTMQVRVAHPPGFLAPDGITAWWPFDGNLRDAIGTRDLTRHAYWESPAFTPGAVGDAVDLRAGGDVMIAGEVGEIGLNDPEGFSIEFRFKPRSAAVGYLFGLFNPATGTADHGLTWGHPNLGSFYRQDLFLQGMPAGESSSSNPQLTTADVSLGVWHHAVITHSRVTHETWLYLDGVARRAATSPITAHFPTGHLLSIGGLPPNHTSLNTAVTTDPYRRFDGELDDFSFYRRPLTNREAEELYLSAPEGKEPPMLNRPPVVDAGDHFRTDDAEADIPLDGFVSDDSGAPLIAWSKVSGPGNSTFADATSPRTTVSFDAPGIYTLRLAADDRTNTTADLVQIHAGLPSAAPAEGLVAWMPGNRHPLDLITGRTGNWSGAEGYAPVKAGDGFQFGDGISRIRYLAPEVAPANTTRGFTIESWLSLPAVLPGGTSELLAFRDLAGTRQHRVYLSETLVGGAMVPQLNWLTRNATNGSEQVQVVKPFPLGEPFHLALTFDPSVSRKKAFVNGVQIADVFASAGTVHHFEKDLHVGGFPGDATNFPGHVDELSLYNIALTPAQIGAIVQAGESGKFPVPPADDPRVNAGPDLALETGETHTFTPVIDAAAFPAGPTVISWTKVSGPGDASFDDPALATASVSFQDAGRHVVSLSVTDGVTTATDRVTIDVSERENAAPSVVLPATATTQLPSAVVDLDPQVADDGRPAGLLEHRWIATGGPGPVAFSSAAGFGTRASFQQAGDYTLILEISDGLATVFKEVAVAVMPAEGPPPPPVPNAAPVVSAGGDFIAEGVTFPLAGTVTDDGKPAAHGLLQDWSLVSGPAAVAFADPSATATTATVPRGGSYRLRLVAFDGELSTTDEIVVTVPDSAAGLPNRAPQVALPPFVRGRLPDFSVTLEAAVADDGRTPGPLAFAWSQLDGPAVAEIAAPGAAETVLRFSTPGDYLFELEVTDGELSTVARVAVQVDPSGNSAPMLSIAAAKPARPLETVTLAATATDDGEPSGTLTYLWYQLAGPAAVDFDTPQAPETAVTFGAGGSYLFGLLVSDGQLSTRATVLWEVVGEPEVRIVSPEADALLPGNTLMELQARAEIDGATITSLRFEEGGQVLGTGALIPGTIDWILTLPSLPAGEHTITARAFSSDGQQALSEEILFTVGDQRTDDFFVEIASPEQGGSVTGPTGITGTVQVRRLASWTLTLAPVAPEGMPAVAVPVEVASGTGPVIQDVLGTLDPTLVLNGAYTLKLTATTTHGSSASDSIPVLIEGNLKIGHFALAFDDLSVPVGGVPLNVTRTYDSRDPRAGDFGPGWTLGFSSVTVRKAGRLGEGWEQEQTISGITPLHSVHPTTRKRVVVSFPGGRTEAFEPVFRALSPLSEEQPNFQKFAAMTEGTLVFKALHGAEGTLEIAGDPTVIWNGPVPGAGTVIDSTFQPVNPRRFRYTAPDGTAYVIDELQGLLSLADPNGNTLAINRNGLVHSSGESVLFTRDTAGRITAVTDPAGGQLLYGYDAAGRLASVTDRVGAVTAFRYENPAFPNYLTSILDPRGVEAIRTEFDEDGRMIRQADASGNAVEFEHHLADNREIIRDRLGNITVHEYDERGNVTRTTDALGGVTRFTYDANDNELSVTSPLGLVTTRTYDSANNLLTETDPGGNVTTYTYDAKRRPLTIADPLGLTTAMTYSGNGNLTRMTDPTGAATVFTYDGGGNLASTIDANGFTTHFTYDGKGRQLTDGEGNTLTYDAAGNRLTSTRRSEDNTRNIVTSSQYDADGRVTLTTLPDGSTSRTVYNAIGKPAKTIDAAGRETIHEYDALGQLVRTTYPDGTSTSTAYDVEGRQTASTDAAGVTTYTLYDALGRATATLLPDNTMPATVLSEVADIAAAPELADNPRRSTSYDADGRVTASTDEHGNVTAYEYDAAGRRTAVVDALGQRTVTAYDAAGRQTAVTDAKGNTTTFEYDAAGRLTRTDFPDGTFTESQYDALGRRVLSTDQEGNSTEFGYSDRGQLVYVIDAEGYYTEYEYDSQRRQTGEIKPNSYTQYRYDDLGRRIARVMPDGAEETFDYDLLGRLVTHTDFNGHVTTRAYDPLTDRLLAVAADPAHPSLFLDHAPARHEFGYDLLGRRTAAVVKCAAGTVLHSDAWSYDVQSRPLVQTSTTGTLRYAWDATGTLAGVKSDTAGGYDLSYDYDALNRLSTVHHGQEGVDPASYPLAAYGYDANGNLAGVGYANQVTHAYAYNTLNRLNGLAVDRQPGGSGAIATPLQGYGYTLNLAGQRTHIAELGGRTVAHAYDALHRLKSETIGHALGNAAPTPLGSISYDYDETGNRLARTTQPQNWVGSTHLGTLLPSQNQFYNERDQLAGDSYDANGNTTSSLQSSVFGSFVSDVYSFDNRLIRRERADGITVDILYRADGDRVAKWTKQGGLMRSIHRYLVDRLNPTGYAQVLEEKDGTGELVARHLYGHDLIASDKRGLGGSPGDLVRSFYNYDGLGSIRGLTDDSGVLQETYDYDAFGTLIGFAKRNGAGDLEIQNLQSPINNPQSAYLFTGEQWDADLGMYFLRARYLNPGSGRFHTEDNYEGRNGEPLTLHKYFYAHANPVMNLDPSGNFTITASLIGRMLFSIAMPTMTAGSTAIRFSISQIQIAIGLKYINRYYPSIISETERQATKVKSPMIKMRFIMAAAKVRYQMVKTTESLLLGTLTVHFGAIYNLNKLRLTVKKMNEDLVKAIEKTSEISGGQIEGQPDKLGAAFSFLTFSASPALAVDALGNIAAARESEGGRPGGMIQTVYEINSFTVAWELSKYGSFEYIKPND